MSKRISPELINLLNDFQRNAHANEFEYFQSAIKSFNDLRLQLVRLLETFKDSFGENLDIDDFEKEQNVYNFVFPFTVAAQKILEQISSDHLGYQALHTFIEQASKFVALWDSMQKETQDLIGTVVREQNPEAMHWLAELHADIALNSDNDLSGLLPGFLKRKL